MSVSVDVAHLLEPPTFQLIVLGCKKEVVFVYRVGWVVEVTHVPKPHIKDDNSPHLCEGSMVY